MNYKEIAHMLKHWVGSNTGGVVTEVCNDGYVWVGFECSECGKISGRHRTKTNVKSDR